MQYVVILEEGAESWGAYVPDLPGCVAAGETREEALKLIQGAIELHLDGMKEDGDAVPEPHSHTEVIQVDAAYYGSNRTPESSRLADPGEPGGGAGEPKL